MVTPNPFILTQLSLLKCSLVESALPALKVEIFFVLTYCLETLRGHFSPYGDIEKVDVIKYKEKNQSRGFAFVYFTDESSFTRAVAETHHIEGKRVNNSTMTKPRLTAKKH